MTNISKADISSHKHTFVDLYTITKTVYEERRKETLATADKCFVYHRHGIDFLHVQDGNKYYCGAMFGVDINDFKGINVVRTEDIHRIYIDKLPTAVVKDAA